MNQENTHIQPSIPSPDMREEDESFRKVSEGQMHHITWFTVRHEIELLFIIVVASLIGFFIMRLMPGYEIAGATSYPLPVHQESQIPSTSALSPAFTQNPTITTTPSATTILTPTRLPTHTPTASTLSLLTPVPSGALSTSAQISPDGMYQVILQAKDEEGGQTIYTCFVSPVDTNENAILLYTFTADAMTTISIPYDTFSPDDRYVFLQETIHGVPHFLVFHASGDPFGTSRYLDVSTLFSGYTSNYVLYQVTGWASNTLLIIETDNGQGPSFWFDAANKSFTPLATRF